MRFLIKIDCMILVGMAGVGKSTTGKLLSKASGFSFVDLDDYISEKQGKTVQQIIDSEGEETFLRLEKQRMYEIDLTHKVIAPGGSIIYHSDLMEYLKQESTVVYLDDSFENIESRLTSASNRGIVGFKEKTLRQIYDERKPLYSKYADITIDCQWKSKEQLAKEILRHFKELIKSSGINLEPS